MITYNSGSFGFQLLLRLHGSAVFKSITPSMISSVLFLLFWRYTDWQTDDDAMLDHPYTMGAMISALTFLLAFRANFSYNRYWEAVTSVLQMHSKWLDVGMELSAFHLQAAIYDARKPPSFGSFPHLTAVERQRERVREMSMAELQQQLDKLDVRNEQGVDGEPVGVGTFRQRVEVLWKRNSNNDEFPNQEAILLQQQQLQQQRDEENRKSINGRPGGLLAKRNKQTRNAWTEPPLFLQEAAHLLSLLSAVALSTLRNDLEQADSPLITFRPGMPWPHVDPDDYGADVRRDWSISRHRTVAAFRYLWGLSRTPTARTLYNAARPFRVIGGVSDAEIELLQAARGPLAKVALCSMWLQEFIARETLHGSTGLVAPPILSRLYQFVSDGMLGYNQARKVAYIPFPFPHAQITSLFVLIVVGFMPILMITFVTSQWLGFFLNLFTVMSFTGLHEVSRELENPFSNVPNDIPLNNFQAQFNEALQGMFAGYHPDSYWQQVPVKTGTADDVNVDINSWLTPVRIVTQSSLAPPPVVKKET